MDEFNGSIRINATVPVSNTETVMEEHTGDLGDRSKYSLTSEEEYTLDLERRVEGDLERVAELLYNVVDDPAEVVGEMIPDEIRDGDEYRVRLRTGDPTVNVNISGQEAVLLAARKRAGKLTRQSMSRVGTSVEQVLIGWMMTDTEEFGDRVTVEEINNLSQAARSVLYSQFIDHTPGGEIDADVVPDPLEWGDRDPEYKEMHPNLDSEE